MDQIVRRITVIHRDATEPRPLAVYEKPRKKRRKVSTWSRPLERAARHLMTAQIALGEEALRRQDKSNRRRRDGWILDAPITVFQAQRKAYNEARKAVPFRLPRA